MLRYTFVFKEHLCLKGILLSVRNAFVDESTLDWEIYIPALMFAYNTSYHRSIQATPFSLTYGIEARLPAFFAPDFRRMHDPDSANENLLGTLQHARDLAVENNLLATNRRPGAEDPKGEAAARPPAAGRPPRAEGRNSRDTMYVTISTGHPGARGRRAVLDARTVTTASMLTCAISRRRRATTA